MPALSDNLLLRAMPSSAVEKLSRHASVSGVKESVMLFRADDRNDVYFPLSGVISLLHEMDDGSEIEFAMVGREGMAGMNVALGIPGSPHAGLMQSSGLIARVAGAAFRSVIEQEPQAMANLLRYAHVMLSNASQVAACNRMHVVPERLAHWLLLLHDRVEGDEMIVTQEFLARMLATRRAGINEAIRELKKSGAIEHRRSRIKVVDRQRLEEESCGCYGSMAAQYERTFGVSPRKTA